MCLCVIDTQNGFEKSDEHPEFVQNCAQAIERAVRKNQPVIYLNYYGYGQPYKELKKLTKTYPREFTVWKYDDDGSVELLDCLKENKLATSHFRLVGLYREACVLSTARGLHNYLPPKCKITILEKATLSYYYWENPERHMNKYYIPDRIKVL